MAKHGVDVSSGPIENVEEGTAVEIWLLEVEIKLSPKILRAGYEVRQCFCFQALSNLIVQFNLGLQIIGCGPPLGKSQACASIKHQQCGTARHDERVKINIVAFLRCSGKDRAVRLEIYTGQGISIFCFDLHVVSRQLGPAMSRWVPQVLKTYRARIFTLMGGFALNIEAHAIGSL